ncbi:MAG: thiol:disulfide interchange protein DsbA/DsbL [Magnetococcales bacterium]|nr:thiol:disulfide interchange protein DsbA/DsbL [Magnetococcales bacterium]MBF0438903.1 thiol:disulfide interchange protein DsbA/DsbL [Magnetococcales bacterium]
MRNFGWMGLFFLSVLFLPHWAAAEPFQPKVGTHYEVISPPVPVTGSKPEVVEVFNFKCPHCFKLHAGMTVWAAKMKDRYEIKSLPIVFSGQADHPLRAFYAGQFMGRESEVKHALFNAQFVDHMNIDSPDELAFMAEGLKLDTAQFKANMNSFGVNGKIAQGRKLSEAYGIASTPTLVINGRFKVSHGKHDNNDQALLFAIVEALAAQ